MATDHGFADGKRDRKTWSIERRAKRRLKRPDERMSRKFVDALVAIVDPDDLTRMRLGNLVWGLFHGGPPPPPLLPA